MPGSKHLSCHKSYPPKLFRISPHISRIYAQIPLIKIVNKILSLLTIPILRKVVRGSTQTGNPYAEKVDRQAGYPEQPQNFWPAWLPFLATRSTISLPHFEQIIFLFGTGGCVGSLNLNWTKKYSKGPAHEKENRTLRPELIESSPKHYRSSRVCHRRNT